MPVRLLAIILLFTSLSACLLPRPWLQPAEAQACPNPQPVGDEPLLFVSFRLPECSNGPLKWTRYRATQAHYGVADQNRNTRRSEEGDWWTALDARVRESGKAPVIYIHGYFNSQDHAVRRGLALRALLCPRDTDWDSIAECRPARPVVALTWPSYNNPAKYTWDEANSEWAVDAAVEAILRIARLYPDSILVAHSMGNRILVPAVLAASKDKLKLERVVLASADVDRAYLARLLARQEGLGVRATLYASLKDQALSLSWRTHGYARGGDLSYWVSGRRSGYPYHTFINAEIVDTTKVQSADASQHAAFIHSEEGAADLCHVLAGEPPVGRDGDGKYPHYFILRAGVASNDDCRTLADAAVRLAGGKSLDSRR